MPFLGQTTKSMTSALIEALQQTIEARIKAELVNRDLKKIIETIIQNNSPDPNITQEQRNIAVKSMENFLKPLLNTLAEDLSKIIADEIKKIFEAQFTAMDSWQTTAQVVPGAWKII